MRTTPLAVAALASALLLTACDSNGGGDDGDKNTKTNTTSAGCTVGVSVAASAAPSAGDTGDVTVTVTNRGTSCTLNGFPGVDLVAGDASKTVPADKGAKPAKLTLAKDATASFTITYTRGEAGGKQSLAVKTAKFTLPGSTAAHSFAWSYGEVALKGDAPQASVTPLTQAGD
ncbi:DUF4232 domain-containing protein [Streptomyces gilvus]|uniref:DUF4232 domain-containing protein n=1 Tax=Streptomyces gilvus TaxID=2920937 RepID=UPI001F0FF6B8|nr:DUF4232 domain-containing protein [Streptomyces sp. CME 23]MCH5675069.1 DUF4232 domain-containing protein [Streptomyces sp. CME 23]